MRWSGSLKQRCAILIFTGLLVGLPTAVPLYGNPVAIPWHRSEKEVQAIRRQMEQALRDLDHDSIPPSWHNIEGTPPAAKLRGTERTVTIAGGIGLSLVLTFGGLWLVRRSHLSDM